jgi:MYXO-CTERM domain-containing protein
MSNRMHPVAGRRSLIRRGAGLAVVGLAAVPVLPLMVGTAHAAGGFSAGDVVVYRVGNGSAALSSTATPVFLDEYPTTPAAAPAFTLPLPTTTTPQDAVTASGTATSEGELNLSTDGSTLLATGYDAAAGSAGVSGTTSAADPRVIAEVDGAGDIDTSTALSSDYSANNIRSAASTNGSTLYAAGPTNGVVETTKGSAAGTQLTPSSGDINFRTAAIFSGQLYASSASGSTTTGIDAIGTGLPGASTTVTNLPGLDSTSGTSSPYGFVLFDETGGTGPDTAYVSDSTAGKILKYTLSGSSWVADGSAGSTTTTGVTGLTGTYTNGVATLYATSPTNLVSLTDTTGQGTLTATPITLATAGTNEAFRGVALAPTPTATTPPPSTPETPLAIALPAAAGVLLVGGAALRRRRRTA